MDKNTKEIVELIYEHHPTEKGVLLLKGKYKDGSFSERVIRILTTSQKEIDLYKAIILDKETSYDKARKTMLKPIKKQASTDFSEELLQAL